MKEKDIYGFEVIGRSGEKHTGKFKRWFGSNTIRFEPMQSDLKDLCVVQTNYGFMNAYKRCKKEAFIHGFEFKTLTEEDFKKIGNPVKKFFKKMFGRK